jgi:uncharacterized protein
VLVPVVLTLVAGAVAGALGALLGIGGGVFLVPFLNLVLGLPFRSASGISLVTVIATSSVTSASAARLRLVNLRLGMVLEIFTTTGGLVGLFFVHRVSEATLRLVFGVVMAAIALVMLGRLDRRNVIRDTDVDVGVLGGRYHEDESGGEIVYRVKRVPVAFGVSFLAGVVSILGIGGGVLKVPALNAWCGIPMRAAAATSALMIAATAVVGAINYFVRGDIVPELAAAAVLGVLAGSRVGFAIGARSNAKSLKVLMAVVLAAVAVIYFVMRAA